MRRIIDPTPRPCRGWLAALSAGALTLLTLIATPMAPAATLPSGFAEVQVASGLDPTAMEVLPDGRVLICEKVGRLRVVKSNTLLATPAFDISGQVDNFNERGLDGVTCDPAFASNHRIYVYYTSRTPATHNRVSRFTLSGDVAGAETVIFECDNLSSAGNHNGGAIHFGPDGKLYVATGNNANAANDQSLGNVLGKVLRINSDGTIPSDNPFVGSTSGRNQAIWALGLRNPFTAAFQPGTGRYFINDVGENSWEEIDLGVAGANYGFTGGATDGVLHDGRFRDPVFTYAHGSGDTRGSAITGGTFYNPATAMFPAGYVGKYFFSDYSNGWIRFIDPQALPGDATDQGAATVFARGIANPVDLRVAPDGALWYLARGSSADNTSSASGSLVRITFTGSQAPSISAQPQPTTTGVGGHVSFTVGASGAAPLTFQWQRGGVDIAGATGATYAFTAFLADNGARFRAVVRNAAGSVTSSEAVLTVRDRTAPVATITAPRNFSLFSDGATIAYAGTGQDAVDGALPASALSWTIVFHHEVHTHPFIGPLSGATGSFTVPAVGETDPVQWYRVHLTVTDSAGLTGTTFVDVYPRIAAITSGGVYRFTSQASGKCLDVPGSTGAAGTVLQQYTDNGTNAQRWKIEDLGDGYRITSQANGLRVDVQGGGLSDGTRVDQAADNGGAAQRWMIVDRGDGTMKVIAKVSGMCLDVLHSGTTDGTPINQSPDNGSDAQRWRIDRIQTSGLASGATYKLTAQCSGKCLDVNAAGTSDGTNVQQWTGNGTPAQRWRLDDQGGGWWKLTAQCSGKCLDVNGASTANDANVQQWTDNGGTAQRWKIDDMGGGWYRLTAQCSGDCLDVDGSGTADGVNVKQHTDNGTAAQRWKIELVAPAALGMRDPATRAFATEEMAPLLAILADRR
ncbi:MAG: RICIN domain-containing protein [Planctomycetes bacterium]|nr:RICIN domain-containing protein [Planctomycetota bacterium]